MFKSFISLAGNKGGLSLPNFYHPLQDPNFIDGFQVRYMPDGVLGATPIFGIKGLISGSNATSTARPLKGPTLFNGQPGLTGSGAAIWNVSGQETIFNSISQMTVAFAGQDAQATLAVVFEGDGSNNDIGILLNDSDSIEGLGSATGWKSAPETLASPKVVTMAFDKNIDRVISFIDSNQVRLTLTNRGSPATPGGTFSNHVMHLFGRASGGAFWTGTTCAILFYRGILEGARLARVKQWIANEGGLVF